MSVASCELQIAIGQGTSIKTSVKKNMSESNLGCDTSRGRMFSQRTGLEEI